MLVVGIVTLIQLFSIGPVGGKVPIIMGTSSGFIGVFNSVAKSMGGGIIAYGAIMGASLIGGLFESVLGFFLKPLRKFFPSVVTGTVVLSIGLSLIAVGVNSFGGGNTSTDFVSAENLFLALLVLVVILVLKHKTTGFFSSSSILIGIIVGYIAAFVMGLILPHTAVNAEGVEYTKSWVLNWSKVSAASWFALPELMPVKPVFDMRATSEQALYLLRRLFYKSQSALTPLLLLSKSNPLRWASIWCMEVERVKSVMSTRTTSSRTSYRSRRRFILETPSLIHSVAPPFQIEPAALGFDFGVGKSIERSPL